MQAPRVSAIPQAEATFTQRPRHLILHSRRSAGVARALPAIEASPIHSVEALAGAMFVASVAACWIAVAATASAPLVAAGELMVRAAKVLNRN